jgi:hypothetical protein
MHRKFTTTHVQCSFSGLGDCKVCSAERMIPVTEDGVRSVLGKPRPPSLSASARCSCASKKAPAQEAAGRATTGVGRAVGVGAASLPSARVQSAVARPKKTVGVEADRESAAPTAGRLRTASPWIVFYTRTRDEETKQTHGDRAECRCNGKRNKFLKKMNV